MSVIATPSLPGIGLGRSLAGVAITPDGTRAYVTNGFSNSVSVIDTASNTVVTTVALGTCAGGVAITPDGTRAYVTNCSDSILVINTASNTVVATVGVGSFPVGVAITPDEGRAYVPNLFSQSGSEVNRASHTLVD